MLPLHFFNTIFIGVSIIKTFREELKCYIAKTNEILAWQRTIRNLYHRCMTGPEKSIKSYVTTFTTCSPQSILHPMKRELR